MAERKTASGTRPPGRRELAILLGRSHGAFEALTHRGAKISCEWKRRNDTTPWVLKVAQGGRTLFYATPKPGAFEATVLLGPRATEAALGGRVSKKLHGAIKASRVYAEGRPVRVVVKNAADAAGVEQLLAVKLDPAGVKPPRSPRIGR